MDARARLPLRFDASALLADARALPADDWVPHFNTAYYEGDWSGAALRSVGGAARQLYPDPAAVTPYADTPLLARCPAAAGALRTFRCPLLAVRFLRLGPGSRIREHRDYNLGFDDGEVRIHVPLSTGPGVEFLHDGERVDMAEGEAWYLDLNLRHSVVNGGEQPRIHLVIDCIVDEWLRTLLTGVNPAG
ncbi:MAG TPA: aspartyl/asparaginyl beta-hydroxylase domain-containing protein [Acidimicrobiales bacterium]